MAEGLQWRSFGRWRFKGVSQPAEVYGVQAAGMPTPGRLRHTAKARRDLPLWRRPLAMAAQAAVLLAAVLGVWLLTRPQPAIAFAERDWVVLGGLHNLTGNRLLDDALDQAFRISLEQSRYVNVVSDDRVGRTLEMMRNRRIAVSVNVAMPPLWRCARAPAWCSCHRRPMSAAEPASAWRWSSRRRCAPWPWYPPMRRRVRYWRRWTMFRASCAIAWAKSPH